MKWKQWKFLVLFTVSFFSKINCEELEALSLVHTPDVYVQSKAPIPPKSSKTPLVVNVDIWIWAVTEVSAQKMEMEVDMYLTFSWFDYRLKFDVNETGDVWLPVGNEEHKLWLPYVTFRNCKGCQPIELNTQKTDILFNAKSHWLKVLTRTMPVFSCNIYLGNYPMDVQRCSIQLENYYEDLSELVFNHIFPVEYKQVASNNSLAEYDIEKISPGNCSAPIFDGREYACVEMNINFNRRLGHYFVTLYAPTFLIVLLSWVGFWLPLDPLPARITLGVTSLLTLATRLDQAQKNLPPVSYVKAIDIWLFVCIFLVFSTLVEFAIAVVHCQKAKKKKSSYNCFALKYELHECKKKFQVYKLDRK